MSKLATVVIIMLIVLLAIITFLWVQSLRTISVLKADTSLFNESFKSLDAKYRASEAKLAEFEVKQRASIQINEEFVVAPNTVHTYTFTPSMLPGILYGSWESSGRGFGGFDSSIAAFRLTDPKDTILQSSMQQSNGNFSAKITLPGSYTFFFDNSGLIRTTPRRVFLRGEYKPD